MHWLDVEANVVTMVAKRHGMSVSSIALFTQRESPRLLSACLHGALDDFI